MKSKRALAAALAALVGTFACGNAEAASDPIHSRTPRFKIPFRYDAAEMQKLGAKSVELYVSTDYGTVWNLAQTVAPQSTHFQFEAPGDGDYWFAVRTVDAQNQPHPSGEISDAGLKVVVDTTQPVLQVSLRQTEAGKVQLSWNANDLHLIEDSLVLEFAQNNTQNWQRVNVQAAGSGQTEWSAPGAGSVEVRGRVNDAAGNESFATAQVYVSPASQFVPSVPSIPQTGQPIAAAEEPRTFSGSLAPQGIAINPGTASAPMQIVPRTGFVSDTSALRPSVVQPRFPIASSNDPPPAPTGIDSLSTPASMTESIPEPEPEPAIVERLVNSRKFHVGYQVDQVGPSGVGSVELFISENGGEKWWKYGTDPDNTSPFEVEVPGDGRYGFAIRVRSGAGLSAAPPSPSEKPMIVVVVDETAPTVTLMAPTPSTESKEQLIIGWEASDDRLSDTPIQLSWSSDPNGPWQTIGEAQANTGTYLWQVDSSIPSHVYMRIQATDQAGNVGQAQSAEPVLVDLSTPSARIVEVETAKQN